MLPSVYAAIATNSSARILTGLAVSGSIFVHSRVVESPREGRWIN
jgi:hypothetical protein